MLIADDNLHRRLKDRWYVPAATGLVVVGLVMAGMVPAIVAFAIVAAASLLIAAIPERAQPQTAAPPVVLPDPGLVRWQMMLDGTHGPSLILDRDDVVIGSNALADSILPNAQGHVVSAVCRAPELLDAIDTAHKSGVQQPCHIARLSAYHGAAVAIVTPLTAQPAPQQAALLIAIRDMTEQEKLSRMRSDFVANASHELRTPLTSMRGFIETLQGPAKEDPEARERFLGIMHEQAIRMSRLVDDLLSLSRVEMKEHVRPTEPVDVASLLEEVVREAAPAAERGEITVALTPLAPLPEGKVRVVGDRDDLRLLLQNLMQNGIKYGRPGGRVDLFAELVDGQRMAIHVRDNGIGIDAVHLPRLTERFYRVSTGESRARGGTGLGLAIVKHIVSRHRGELAIKSELGVGSTFTVKLPLAK